MNKVSPDLLIYVLIFLGVLLFNYVARLAAKRQQDEAAAAEPAAEEAPLEEIFGRAPPVTAPVRLAGAAPVPALASETRPVAVAVPRRHAAERSFLKNKRDLQRAVIAMTILGPCRAQEGQSGKHADERR